MLYPGDTVRLLRELSRLPKGKECEVVGLAASEEKPVSVQIKYYAGGSAQTATVPLDAVEPVLSEAAEQRTAGLWGLEKPAERFIEASLHALMDQCVPGRHLCSQRTWFAGRSSRAGTTS